jgi:hypothetical protein
LSKENLILSDYIDLCNTDTTSKVFKFNFIFDRIKLSHHSLSYIIRYIDNKNDKSNSDEESYEIAELIISQYKKE